MSKMKTIGIIGGMGPMATVDLMKKVILATDAREDQDKNNNLVDIISYLESNSLEGMLPNILRRQQSHKSCTSLQA